jgi:hypothetical protein
VGRDARNAGWNASGFVGVAVMTMRGEKALKVRFATVQHKKTQTALANDF